MARPSLTIGHYPCWCNWQHDGLWSRQTTFESWAGN